MTLSQREIQNLIDSFRFKKRELEKYVEAGDEQSLINAARIMRDLFVSDANGLVGAIASGVPGFRTRRRSYLRFETQLLADSHYRRVGVEASDFKLNKIIQRPEGDVVHNYKRDGFMRMPIIDIYGDSGRAIFTVLDIIKFFSNKLGAVHIDYKKTGDATDFLRVLWENEKAETMPKLTKTMIGIGSIVLKTCRTIDNRLSAIGY